MLYPPEDPRKPNPGSALSEETVELGEVALALGLSAQGVWAVIEQECLRVLRLTHQGRSRSAITRVDFDRLLVERGCRPLAELVQPQGPSQPSEPLVQRVREAERQSSKLEAGVLEMRMRLAQSGLKMSEAQQRMRALRERFDAELTAAQTQLETHGHKLEVSTERERDLTRQLGDERERYQRELLGLHAELDQVRRELDVAEELERANGVYLDRLEREARGRRLA